MKKLFCALASMVIISSGSLSMFSFINSNINNLLKEQEVKSFSPNSVKNIIRNFNNFPNREDIEVIEKDENISQLFDKVIEGFYQDFFTNDIGNLISLQMIPQTEVELQTFNNNYTNATPNEQTFYTQEYERTISDSFNFSMSLAEKTSFTTKVNVSFLGEEIEVSLSSEKKWSTSRTQSEKLKNPSQPFKVSPYSVGKVLYVVKQGLYKNKGVVQFLVDLKEDYFEIPNIARDENGKISYSWVRWTVKEIINRHIKLGYGEQLKLTNSEYSIITTDDLENPTKAYFNLPIEWESQGGKLDVTFSEEPLAN